MRSALIVFLTGLVLANCGHREVSAKASSEEAPTVGVAPVALRSVDQQLTLSSELTPFQEIDVYAKEAGYVKQLSVDYGSHVHAGQIMAVLEIPELEAQLQQDRGMIEAQSEEAVQAGHQVGRVKAQAEVARLQYDRLAGVAKTQPGLVAQQEVDDAQGKDLAAQSQVEAAQGALAAAKGQLTAAQAKLAHDQVLYDYAKIIAPFDGVVTQRYANLGALMQAGTSSTQATPLVRLSQENLYRLVIPVPESYVRYIKIGGPVEVRIPSLGQTFTGKITRTSIDVQAATRTMHTEVDVPNSNGQLVPGMYAEAVLGLNARPNVLVAPLEAINREGERTSVYLVDSSNRIVDRPITLGAQTPTYAEILSGVKQGDLVVVSDRSGLTPGQPVKPQRSQHVAYETSGTEQPR